MQQSQNRGVPTRAELSRYSVNRAGWEAVRQSLYDYQVYAAAGQSQLSFFVSPVGGTRTASDTNMTLAGQLPKNQEFLVQSVEVFFTPTTPTVAAQMPASFGAQAAAQIVNDSFIVGRSGNLTFTIGSKPYLQDAPLGRFPQKAYFCVEGAAADTSTAGVNLQSRIVYGHWGGRPYLLDPAPLLLPENQNFAVTLSWPEGAQAITSPGRIGVILDGILYRRSQ